MPEPTNAGLIRLIDDVLTAGRMTEANVDALKTAVMDPNNQQDLVEASEKTEVARLAEALTNGTVQVDANAQDVYFEVENILNTEVYDGCFTFWGGSWWNNDRLAVDLKGVTIVEPWFTGNDRRAFVPYQAIESASYEEGWFFDGVYVKVSGGESGHGLSIAFDPHSDVSKSVPTLINDRLEDWNERINAQPSVGTTGTSAEAFVRPANAGCTEGIHTVEGPQGRSYDIYTSPNCEVSMSPVRSSR